jgi:hypothetical protein
MSSQVTGVIQMRGLAAVDEQLAALGRADGTRILRKSMLLGGVPILNHAKATVAGFEHGSGALHKSLGMRFLYGRQKRQSAFVPPMGGNFRVQIMPFAKDRTAIALYTMYYKLKRSAKRLSYAHLVEWGFRTGDGGRVSARSFLGAAARAERMNAVAIFTREMNIGIDKQLKRNAKKAKKSGSA